MKISFCTTCMGRAHHLKETLLQNISDVLSEVKDYRDFEFVVLNYSSPDDLHDWIMNDPEMRDYMKLGILNYIKHDGEQYFKHSHAKNMAHRLATGDVLCNLDADNFLGKGFYRYLRVRFSENINSIVYPGQIDYQGVPLEERGFVGRIAISADNYYMLGGYNEKRNGWGGEDVEFVARAVEAMLDVEFCHNSEFLNVIRHSHEDRLRYADIRHIEGNISNIKSNQNKANSLTKVFNKLGFLLERAQVNRNGDFGLGDVSVGREQLRSSLISAKSFMKPCRRHVRGVITLLSTHAGPKVKVFD